MDRVCAGYAMQGWIGSAAQYWGEYRIWGRCRGASVLMLYMQKCNRTGLHSRIAQGALIRDSVSVPRWLMITSLTDHLGLGLEFALGLDLCREIGLSIKVMS